MRNREALFCEADLVIANQIAAGLETLKSHKDTYFPSVKQPYLTALKEGNLDVYNQLNQLGSKIFRRDRYQESRTVLYTLMLGILSSMPDAISELGNIDPLTKMRIAVINVLERNKTSDEIPEDFQRALSLVQQECKKPGAPFIQQMLDSCSQNPDDDEDLDFTGLSLSDVLADPVFIAELTHQVRTLHPELARFTMPTQE